MRAFARRLGGLGRVACFDYRYQVEGRRSPDRLEKLLEAHQQACKNLRAEHSGPIVFVGKSMGSRIGCHLANQMEEIAPLALVCFGYPLVGQKGAVRDEVLVALRRPILFVQGTRDALCPIERLNAVRKRMSARNELHIVQGGDHSLRVSARALSEQGRTQSEIDAEIVQTVSGFLESLNE
jgi:predicted alpha/beta-hydrolase family hydrolase